MPLFIMTVMMFYGGLSLAQAEWTIDDEIREKFPAVEVPNTLSLSPARYDATTLPVFDNVMTAFNVQKVSKQG